MTRPRLLDLFCGAGGAAMGYHRAGFDVIGVDNRPQPRYPFEFIKADALSYLAYPLRAHVDAIHASPPCQAYSITKSLHSREHPDLLAPTRALLQQSGLPWVIENVPGAPMDTHVILCGTMFGLVLGDEWELWRHRWFETSGFFMLTPPCQHNGSAFAAYGGYFGTTPGARYRAKQRRALGVYGNGGGPSHHHTPKGSKASIAEARELMGIDWMNTAEIQQAIPPAYTEYIGRQLLEHMAGAA